MTDVLSPVLPNSMELGEIVEQVWESFLGGGLMAAPQGQSSDDFGNRLAAWVAISGEWTGHLMVVTSQVCAQQIAADMFEMDTDEISTAEIADALGEIANMVGGSVKGMIGVAATLSLPQVVLDAAALVSPEARQLVCVEAEWKSWPLEFSLWERNPNGGTGAEGAGR